MNRKQQSVVLASLLALALAGCTSTKTAGDETASSSGATSASPAAPPAAVGAPATAATETPMAMPPQEPGAQSPAPTAMPATAPNAVVVSIETVPRQGAGSTSMGTSTAGATGSSMGQDKQYRITLRMDDGATRVVTQDKAPTFRNGDRVNMSDGIINR